jgi:hypothetical protein
MSEAAAQVEDVVLPPTPEPDPEPDGDADAAPDDGAAVETDDQP